jgi:N-acetylneuraminic acid mutarotase
MLPGRAGRKDFIDGTASAVVFLKRCRVMTNATCPIGRRALGVLGVALLACGGTSATPVDPCPDGSCVPPDLDGAWAGAAPLPTARREMPGAALNGRIYVTGGFSAAQQVLTTVEAYDTASARWSALPPMPARRHHHGVTAANGSLYVIGGYAALGATHADWQVTATVFEFDPVTSGWRQRSSLPAARGASAVAAHDGRIYVFGGADATTATRTTFIYDPASDTWSEGEPMPAAREHVAAVTLGSEIFVVGGRALHGANLSPGYAYSPGTNSWRALAPMQRSRSGHGLAVLNGRIYAIGGEDILAGAEFDTVEEYDPAANRWRSVQRLPAPVTGAAVVGLGARIHVIGGNGSTTAGQQHRVLTFP